MASGYTANYGLSQWEPGDSFMRTEFNADNAKVDAALHGLETGKADRAALESVSGTVELKCRMKAGDYRGNGKASRTIDVGFPVLAVLVERRDGYRSPNGCSGGLALSGSSLYNKTALVSVSGSGFTVWNEGEFEGAFNVDGEEYHYVAWG